MELKGHGYVMECDHPLGYCTLPDGRCHYRTGELLDVICGGEKDRHADTTEAGKLDTERQA